MTSPLQCEICKTTHRAGRWRTPAAGSVVLCVSCKVALDAVTRWRDHHPHIALDTLIAELPASLPNLPAAANDVPKEAA